MQSDLLILLGGTYGHTDQYAYMPTTAHTIFIFVTLLVSFRSLLILLSKNVSLNYESSNMEVT